MLERRQLSTSAAPSAAPQSSATAQRYGAIPKTLRAERSVGAVNFESRS